MKYLILDFNGTILDDVDLSIHALKHVAGKYLGKSEVTLEEYRSVFTFPVKKYYENFGFDFEVLDWESVGQEWMDEYNANKDKAKLYPGVRELLTSAKEKGCSCVVLSASRLTDLKAWLSDLGIIDYFDTILGIDNIYATSKIPLAKEFIRDKNREDCLMIGDTLHDFDVSKEMGVRCILVANGHQSKEDLLKSGAEVVDDIREVRI